MMGDMSKTPITTAIIGTNGYSTRRLPITAAIPKDFTPIGNKPAIDYVVDSLVGAGITDIYFVVHPHHESIYRTYFESYPELDEHLRAKGKTEELALIVGLRERANFHFIPRPVNLDRYGTAIPLLEALDVIGRKPCVYVSSDDFTVREDGGSDIADLLDAYNHGDVAGALIGVPVPTEKLHSFGVLQVREEGERLFMTGVVEKPEHPEDLPEPHLANISKYVIGEELLPYLDRMKPNAKSGEYVIFEVFADVDGKKVEVVPAQGAYYDVGTLENWMVANAKLA